VLGSATGLLLVLFMICSLEQCALYICPRSFLNCKVVLEDAGSCSVLTILLSFSVLVLCSLRKMIKLLLSEIARYHCWLLFSLGKMYICC
jgi:hypothetical protein